MMLALSVSVLTGHIDLRVTLIVALASYWLFNYLPEYLVVPQLASNITSDTDVFSIIPHNFSDFALDSTVLITAI